MNMAIVHSNRKISTDNAFPAKDKDLAMSNLLFYRTQCDDIFLETLSNKAMLLCYFAFDYIRLHKYFTPQGMRPFY